MNNFMTLILRKYFKYTQWGHDELDIERNSVLHFGTDCISEIENLEEMFSEFGINQYPQSVTEFYEILGFKRVVVLEPSEVNLDDYVLSEDNKGSFDLVVNAAASGKISDQYRFFSTVHDATAQEGYLIHILPYFNQNDAHLYNYQPNFVGKMCWANKYTVNGSWMSRDKHDELCMFLPNHEPSRDEIFDEYAVKEQEKPIYLGCVLQKVSDQAYRARPEEA